jgi:hypothetical protein
MIKAGWTCYKYIPYKRYGISDLSDVTSTINNTGITIRRDSWAPGVTANVVEGRIVRSDDPVWIPNFDDYISDDWTIGNSALCFVEAVKCLYQSTACNTTMRRSDNLIFTINHETETLASPIVPILRYNDIIACDWQLFFANPILTGLIDIFPSTESLAGNTMSDLSDVISTVNFTNSTVRRISWDESVTAQVVNEQVVKSDDPAWQPSLEDMVASDWVIAHSALGFVEAVKCLHRSTACNAGMKRGDGVVVFYLNGVDEILTSRPSGGVLTYNDIVALDWQLVFY